MTHTTAIKLKQATATLAAILIIPLMATVFSACSDDDDDDTTINIDLEEVGHDNSKEGVIGDDMHLEANITADDLIKQIDVKLDNGSGYAIEATYTGKYAGVKNTLLHEHVEIPADAPEGTYTLTVTVRTQNNNWREVTTGGIELKKEETEKN